MRGETTHYPLKMLPGDTVVTLAAKAIASLCFWPADLARILANYTDGAIGFISV